MKLTDPIELVLKSKADNRVLFVTPGQSVYEAIEKMAEQGVGALLVIRKIDWSECCQNVTMHGR